MPYVKLIKQNQSELIEIPKIICMASNYLAHTLEMNATKPEEPVLFLKPPSAVIHSGETVILPRESNHVHYEVELVLLIGKKGKRVPMSEAMEYICGYGVGLDMTLRDFQLNAKKSGRPWGIAKGFDTSAPLSDFISSDRVSDPQQLELELRLNNQLVQKGNTSQMTFNIKEIIAYTSNFFTLTPGDLIFTGTPEGVGPVKHGDRLSANLAQLTSLSVDIEKEG